MLWSVVVGNMTIPAEHLKIELVKPLSAFCDWFLVVDLKPPHSFATLATKVSASLSNQSSPCPIRGFGSSCCLVLARV